MRFSAFVTVAAVVAPALAQHAGHDGMAVGPVVASVSVESAPKTTAAWAAPEAEAPAPKKATASYAPISQIGDGQIQAPTATPPAPAPPASAPPAAPAPPPKAYTPAAPAPPAGTTPAPAPPAEDSSTQTNTKTKTGTRTLSLSSPAAAAPPVPTVSTPPPPAVQTGAAAIMNAASGLSFAAFVAFVLA